VALGEAMNLSEVEEKCRNMIHQMVVPVIELTRSNIEFNSNKNDKLLALEARINHMLSKQDE
jgi:hypothetical protein